MFEWAFCLGLVVHQLLLDPGHAALLVVRELVQISQRVLYALDRSNRIHGIQLGGVCGLSAYEHVRNAFVVLEQSKAASLAPTENLEAPKKPTRL